MKHSNSMSFIITILLLSALIYAAYYAGFWNVMLTWDWNTWSIFFFGMVIAWTARNELEGGGR